VSEEYIVKGRVCGIHFTFGTSKVDISYLCLKRFSFFNTQHCL